MYYIMLPDQLGEPIHTSCVLPLILDLPYTPLPDIVQMQNQSNNKICTTYLLQKCVLHEPFTPHVYLHKHIYPWRLWFTTFTNSVIFILGISKPTLVCFSVQLTAVNEKLGEIALSEQGNGPAMLHTLQRHRDILQDYTQEFRKTQQNYQARRERENLLHSVKKDIEWVCGCCD